MRTRRPATLPVAFISALFVSLFVPAAMAADDDDSRDVRLGIVQGDVRVSRGHKGRSDLKQPWEEATLDENISQGFAIATGNGRASIDFEDGSTIYLAENSLLVFNDLSSNDKGDLSGVTLVTGTATFDLKPQAENRFAIKTPTDSLFVDPPENFHGRIDAYLDATAITPQGDRGETLNRSHHASLHFNKGESVYLSDGQIVESSAQTTSEPKTFSQKVAAFCSQSMAEPESQERLAEFCESLHRNPSIQSRLLTAAETPERTIVSANAHSQPPTEWDNWVSGQLQEKTSLTTAALKASGLSAPVPGLADLYQRGRFFECAPYGTCWEPLRRDGSQQIGAATPPSTQSASAPQQSNPSSPVFVPKTITWDEASRSYERCTGDFQFHQVSMVAHDPLELDMILRRKAQAERMRSSLSLPADCFQAAYVFHNDRYCPVISRAHYPSCKPGHAICKKHPPFPHGVIPVRLNGKLGFVPRHPNDVKGKPPLNLKNGVLFFPEKPGQPIHRVAFDPSQRLKIENKVPTELQREFAARPPVASAPEIHAHFMSDAVHPSAALTASSANSSAPRITLDYKSQKFMMSNTSPGDKHERPVAVAGLSGNRISTFSGSNSGHAGGTFDRSGGYSGRGSGYSGSGGSGGRYSGSGSSGSHSGGSGSSGSSHSYGGSSSGGNNGTGGSHSSGSGSSSSSSGSGGSSSSSSSSSSSTGGGGGPRPH